MVFVLGTKIQSTLSHMKVCMDTLVGYLLYRGYPPTDRPTDRPNSKNMGDITHWDVSIVRRAENDAPLTIDTDGALPLHHFGIELDDSAIAATPIFNTREPYPEVYLPTPVPDIQSLGAPRCVTDIILCVWFCVAN